MLRGLTAAGRLLTRAVTVGLGAISVAGSPERANVSPVLPPPQKREPGDR